MNVTLRTGKKAPQARVQELNEVLANLYACDRALFIELVKVVRDPNQGPLDPAFVTDFIIAGIIDSNGDMDEDTKNIVLASAGGKGFRTHVLDPLSL